MPFFIAVGVFSFLSSEDESVFRVVAYAYCSSISILTFDFSSLIDSGSSSFSGLSVGDDCGSGWLFGGMAGSLLPLLTEVESLLLDVLALHSLVWGGRMGDGCKGAGATVAVIEDGY